MGVNSLLIRKKGPELCPIDPLSGLPVDRDDDFFSSGGSTYKICESSTYCKDEPQSSTNAIIYPRLVSSETNLGYTVEMWETSKWKYETKVRRSFGFE